MNMICRSIQDLTDDIVYIMPISGATSSIRSLTRRAWSFMSRPYAVVAVVACTVASPDNGGSTSEIVRVLGGPAIGDIRSRMVRLADDSSPEAKSLSELLQYRLPLSADDAAIRGEWFQLIDGSHRCVRAFRDPAADGPLAPLPGLPESFSSPLSRP